MIMHADLHDRVSVKHMCNLHKQKQTIFVLDVVLGFCARGSLFYSK